MSSHLGRKPIVQASFGPKTDECHVPSTSRVPPNLAEPCVWIYKWPMKLPTTASASALWLQTCWWLNTASPSMCPFFFQLSLLPCPQWEWPSQQLQTEAPPRNSCLAKGNHSFKPKMCPKAWTVKFAFYFFLFSVECYQKRDYILTFCGRKKTTTLLYV